MTDIDAIRKKHEERKKKLAMAPFEYVTGLSVADVDALFAALDEARGSTRRLPSSCSRKATRPPGRGASEGRPRKAWD